MKKAILSTLIILAGFSYGYSQVTETTETATETATPAATDDATLASLENVTFGVRGNCGMCKRTIEKGAAIDGVSKADWDVDKKQISVSYDPSKTNLMAIHEAIASTGYDTDQVTAEKSAYNKIHGCCKYDRKMEMSQAVEEEESN